MAHTVSSSVRIDNAEPAITRSPEQFVGARQVAEVGFTPREHEVIVLLAQGASNQAFAERSYLSINSVKTYIRTAYCKMGVQSRTQALLWRFDLGLCEADPDGQDPVPG